MKKLLLIVLMVALVMGCTVKNVPSWEATMAAKKATDEGTFTGDVKDYEQKDAKSAPSAKAQPQTPIKTTNGEDGKMKRAKDGTYIITIPAFGSQGGHIVAPIMVKVSKSPCSLKPFILGFKRKYISVWNNQCDVEFFSSGGSAGNKTELKSKHTKIIEEVPLGMGDLENQCLLSSGNAGELAGSKAAMKMLLGEQY